jgi:hypothetical protein
MLFDPSQISAIAEESCRDPRSVIAVFEGRARPKTEKSVRQAAARLGIELPQNAASALPAKENALDAQTRDQHGKPTA